MITRKQPLNLVPMKYIYQTILLHHYRITSQFGVHEIYQTILRHNYQKTTPQFGVRSDEKVYSESIMVMKAKSTNAIRQN